jgi:hypothetical protein
MVALIAKVGSLADRVCIKLLRRCEAQRPARPHAMRRVPGRHFSLELLLSTGQLNARILIGESLQPLTVFRHLNACSLDIEDGPSVAEALENPGEPSQ